MPCNVFGTDEAIANLAKDVDAERAKDRNFPLAFAIDDIQGAVLEVEERQALWSDEFLSAIAHRHPNVALAVADVGVDEDDDGLMHASVLLYSKGRRRVAKACSFREVDRAALQRLERMLLRLEQRWRRRYAAP